MNRDLMNPNLIYKILPQHEWQAAQAAGEFRGSGIDLADGFIHLSSADQFHETLEKHFAGQTDLIGLGVDPEKLGDSLRWEKSRNDDLFPHVYGVIPIDAVTMHWIIDTP